MTPSFDWNHTALIIVDPQIDVLSSEGAAWDLFGSQVVQRGTVGNLRDLRYAAESAEVPTFYSRIEVTDHDYEAWQPHNGLQQLMGERKLFRKGAGARFLPELEPSAKTVLLSPRKGPSSVHSDVADQLRKRGIQTIVVAGMVANLCVESQVRDATDDGFDAIVVGDAIATIGDEAHEAALANFGLLATHVVSTQDVVRALRGVGARTP